MRGSSIFGAEDRRLKRGGSTIFGSEDRRWGVLRSSGSKNKDGGFFEDGEFCEDGQGFFEEPLPSSKNPSPIFVPRPRCESMLNFTPALAFNGCFASGAGIHPWIATGRAWTGASEARIGHTPLHLLTKSLPVSGNLELNGRLTGKRV